MLRKLIFTSVISGLSLSFHAQKNATNQNCAADYQKSMKLIEDEKFEDAQDLLEDIPEQDPLYLNAQYRLLVMSVNRENFPKAIAIAENLSKLSFLDGHKIYNFWALALSNMEKHEDALNVVNQGLKIYSESHLLHYRHGMVLQDMNRHQDALLAYQRAILAYPFHYFSHLKIGEMAAHEGRYTQAIMSMTFATLLDMPVPLKANTHATLEKISSLSFDEKPKNVVFEEGDDFSEIDRIIKSRIALSTKFKLKTKLKKILFIRQLQVICEALRYKKNVEGFWMHHYVPLFEEVYKDNMFDGLTYLSLSGPDYGSFNKAVDKNQRRLQAFMNWFSENLGIFLAQQYTEFEGKKQFVYIELGKDNISSRGLASEFKNHQGVWQLYSGFNGRPIGSGNYTEGRREGEWLIYDEETGKLLNKLIYKDGKLDGSQITYYPGSQIREISEMKNDERLGKRIVFFPSQDTMFIEDYINDKLNGKVVQFFADNSIKLTGAVNNGNWTREVLSYHTNGQLKSNVMHKDDVENGPFSTYHPNGQLHQKGTYKMGKVDGAYEVYFENGQMETKGSFKNGIQVGKWNYNYADGKLKQEMEFDENGKENAVQKVYDRDGKLHYEMEYKIGELQSFTFYNKAGKIFSQAKRIGKTLNYKFYNPFGVLTAEGQLISDEKSDKWKYFDDHGVLQREQTYANGKVKGIAKSYFPSGQVKTQENYDDDKLDGLYLSYYENGALNAEGYFKKGEQTGMWYYYYPDGVLREKKYFVDDEPINWTEEYAVTGLIHTKSYFENGEITQKAYFDMSGKPLDTIKYYHGEVVLPNPNGKDILAKNNFKNDVRHLLSTAYYLDGKVSSTSHYFNGELNGLMHEYYENGQLSSLTKYINDERDSVRTKYRINGNVASRAIYKNGVLEGLTEEYHPDGSLHYKANYINGSLEGEVVMRVPSGEIYAVLYFENNNLVAYSYEDKSGNLKERIAVEADCNMTCYFRNGVKSFSATRKNGQWHEDYLIYNPKGEVIDHSKYHYGDFEGEEKFSFSANLPYSSISYSFGYRNGPTKINHLNGKLMLENNYVWGKKHGEEKEYDKNGKLIFTRMYYNDCMISQTKH